MDPWVLFKTLYQLGIIFKTIFIPFLGWYKACNIFDIESGRKLVAQNMLIGVQKK